MFNLENFIDSQICLACDGCCRFKDKLSIWSPHRINTIAYKDFFICERFDPEANKCKDYQNRPFDCRIYPFLLHKDKSKFFLAVHLQCIFLQQSDPQQLNKLLQDMVCYFKKKELIDFLKNNRDMFVAYPDEVRIVHSLNLDD